MIQTSPTMRILVATQPVDFRKGIDGLAATCRKQLEEDPMTGCLFVFRNRKGTALKLFRTERSTIKANGNKSFAWSVNH
jgi:transposase